MTLCKLTGDRFPEYDQWLAEHEADRIRRKKELKEFREEVADMMVLEAKRAERAIEDRLAAPKNINIRHDGTVRNSQDGKERVGRNDPCPCGSGKKFKKCCMRSES